jgi:predicted MFS family arabinose efflux permease
VLLAQFLSPLVAFSIGALAPLLRDALALTREQVGSLTALYYAGTALACLPAGWTADRLGIRLLLIAAQVLAGVPLLAVPLLPAAGPLRLIIFVAGLAYGTVTVVTGKAIGEWFPREQRATAFGAKLLALSCAGIGAAAAVPALALWAGWRQVFAGLGAALIASSLMALLLYREHPSDTAGAEPLTTPEDRCALWGNPHLWRLAGVGCLYGGAQDTFITYLALFLQERWGLPLTLSASLLVLAQLAAAGCRVPYGWVSDHWMHGRRHLLLRILGALAVGALVALLVLPPGTAYPVLPLIVLLFGVSGMSWGGIYITLASELSGRAAGVGVGLATTFMYLGSSLTLPLFGRLADVTGSYAPSWGVLILWLLVGMGWLPGVSSSAWPPQPAMCSMAACLPCGPRSRSSDGSTRGSDSHAEELCQGEQRS